MLTRVSQAESATDAQLPGRATRHSRKARAHGTIVRAAGLRPWERIAAHMLDGSLENGAPEWRLALEIAATEEVERAGLRDRAEALTEELRDEEEIGAIADDLLVPDAVRTKLEELERERDGGHDDARNARKAT